MSIVLNRTRETVSVGGASNLTLSGAVSGHQTFNTAAGTSRYFYYWIEDGTAWETGIGHMTTSTNFVRDTLIASSTGSFLTVTTSAEVFSEAPGTGLPPAIPYTSSRNIKTIPPSNWVQGLTTVVVTADRVYYCPYKLETTQKVDRLLMRCSSAVGTKLRMGIYHIGSDGEPQELIQETADITPSAAGLSGTFTAIELPSGWYFTAVVCDAAETLYAFNSTSDYIFGPLGGNNATTLASYSACQGYEDSASWTAMPSTAAITAITAAKTPRVIMGVV